jgi:hypothetical protein
MLSWQAYMISCPRSRRTWEKGTVGKECPLPPANVTRARTRPSSHPVPAGHLRSVATPPSEPHGCPGVQGVGLSDRTVPSRGAARRKPRSRPRIALRAHRPSRQNDRQVWRSDAPDRQVGSGLTGRVAVGGGFGFRVGNPLVG